MSDAFSKFSSQLKDVYNRAGVGQQSLHRRSVTKFADHYGLTYFGSIHPSTYHLSTIRGVTSSLNQKDMHICIGTHDGYDVMYLERLAMIEHPDFEPASHRWHIMSFDLHSHRNLPFIFIGTRQQSHAFYAKLFTSHRDVRHIDTSYLSAPTHFSSHYTVIASPAEQLALARVLTTPITATMAKYQHPFAIEIFEDTLYVITESRQTSESQLVKMLHYGLWLARHIDQQVII